MSNFFYSSSTDLWGENTKKKFLIIILIMFFIVSINFVSANDDLSDVVSLSEDTDGDFTELKNYIANSSEIKLNKSYTYNSSDNMVDGIALSDTLTIDGDGHSINGNNLARIFTISGANSQITLKNINFVNGSATKKMGEPFIKLIKLL